MKKAKFASLALAAVLAAGSLTGCGGSSSSAPASAGSTGAPASGGEKQVIEIAVFEGPAYDSDTPLKDVILPGYLDSKKFQPYGDGKIYIAPKDCGYSGMVYNKALFEAKGWAVPETWDEFFALGDQAKAEGRALFTYPVSYTHLTLPTKRIV